MSAGLRVTAHARTDVGKVREGNEDDYYVGENVFAVADGMGGHAAGEVASRTALEPVAGIDGLELPDDDAAEEALVEAVREANRQVVEKAEAQPDLRGMGTTLTAAMLRAGRLHVAHVGDSRAYLLRPGEAIAQLTTDHTLVERLIRDGRLSREEAAEHPQRNVITRAIGNEPSIVVDALPPLRLEPGDRVLLCSDGLNGPVPDVEIAAVLEQVADGAEAVDRLVQQANDAGGPDNITVVLLDVEATAEPVTDGPEPTAPVRRIRTDGGGDGDDDWATAMGRYGAPQGAPGTGEPSGRGRARKLVGALLGVVLLLGLAAGGGWMLLSRAYFVGDHQGVVAVHQGLPQEVGGVALHRVIDDEVTDLALEEFPEWRQERIREGITAGTLEEARRHVAELEATLGDRDADDAEDEPAGEADDEPAGDTSRDADEGAEDR